MHNRHRIPTIFSIYMVDVLCCALGCVILLWQVNHQEAMEQTAEAQKKTEEVLASMEQLKKAQLDINSLSSEVHNLQIALTSSKSRTVEVTLQLDDARKAHEQAEKLALVRKNEYDGLRQTHEQALAVLANLKLEVKNLEEKSTLTARELSEKIRAHADLLKKIADAEGRIAVLQKDLQAREGDLTSASKSLQDQLAKMTTAEKQLASLQKQSSEVLNKLQLSDLRAKLLEQELAKHSTDSQRKIQELLLSEEGLNKKLMISAKDLDQLKGALTVLQNEKVSLLQQNRTMQAKMESRFAGITLTGKRVLIMVDMSGSMELLDMDTADPDKWPIVCETVAKILDSLPNVEYYQVLLFSDRVRYPMGQPSVWMRYDGKETPKSVAETLKKIKPQGETNMYAAFEEAFRFRSAGLDTIYLLSDGLPNAGEGVPANMKLTEPQKTDYLTRAIRQRLKTDWNRSAPNRVKINTVGFFFESPEVGSFLWALSRENDGSFVGMSKP